MKKGMMKKAISMGLAALGLAGGLLTGGLSAQAANSATYTNASQVATYVYQGYNEGVRGPITITQGTLMDGKKQTQVYLVTLSGTESVENQSTGYWTDALAGFNLDNAYSRNTVAAISSEIPKGSNIILAGHSLGGMVAQQVAANNTIKNDYNVMNTVCFGSPLLSAGSREGDVKRLGDTSDPVPYMSGSLINNGIWAIAGLNRESGNYGTKVVDAHVESYKRADVWGKYDVVGKKNGSAKLSLNLDTLTFYQSPAN